MQHIKNTKPKTARPLVILAAKDYPKWLKKQPAFVLNWLTTTHFEARAGKIAVLPNAKGHFHQALGIIGNFNDPFAYSFLAAALPKGAYFIDGSLSKDHSTNVMLGWLLACYAFTKYKKSAQQFATLVAPPKADRKYALNMATAITMVRDLINTPAHDLGPADLEKATRKLGKRFQAKVSAIIGNDLVKKKYPTLHFVGKSSVRPPRLIMLEWGKKTHPTLALVGKGICFDTGGLDIKPAAFMKNMKKDMGGAAHVLALAHLIMAAKLPLHLKIYISAADNDISSTAMRPMDVIKTRSGKTVEVGHTDAEGRLAIADPLYEASHKDGPALLIDITTLTGAAKVATGNELGCFFSTSKPLQDKLVFLGEKLNDPLWPLPLHQPYRRHIEGITADLTNNPASSYGAAITAGLFLKEFVKDGTDWLHFDLYAWNDASTPGHPRGGEAQGLRALFALIEKKLVA